MPIFSRTIYRVKWVIDMRILIFYNPSLNFANLLGYNKQVIQRTPATYPEAYFLFNSLIIITYQHSNEAQRNRASQYIQVPLVFSPNQSNCLLAWKLWKSNRYTLISLRSNTNYLFHKWKQKIYTTADTLVPSTLWKENKQMQTKNDNFN